MLSYDNNTKNILCLILTRDQRRNNGAFKTRWHVSVHGQRDSPTSEIKSTNMGNTNGGLQACLSVPPLSHPISCSSDAVSTRLLVSMWKVQSHGKLWRLISLYNITNIRLSPTETLQRLESLWAPYRDDPT